MESSSLRKKSQTQSKPNLVRETTSLYLHATYDFDLPGKSMDSYGYFIVQALVTDIEPDATVKKAMNEINAAQRLRVAATDKAEAEKILRVKAAEAEAESKFLGGQGIARARKAIIEGLRESVTEFTEAVPGTTSQHVMDLILMTQYFDALKGKS